MRKMKTAAAAANAIRNRGIAGSGLIFEDAGAHELKGLPDRWRLYRVVSSAV
jgi:hypothetical protein